MAIHHQTHGDEPLERVRHEDKKTRSLAKCAEDIGRPHVFAAHRADVHTTPASHPVSRGNGSQQIANGRNEQISNNCHLLMVMRAGA